MFESNKKIWEKLEENIGHCILFRDAALKEILGEESFTLQFATLTVPEKVEAFLEGNENIKIIRNETCNYLFAMDGTRIEIHCFDSKFGFDLSQIDEIIDLIKNKSRGDNNPDKIRRYLELDLIKLSIKFNFIKSLFIYCLLSSFIPIFLSLRSISLHQLSFSLNR